MSNTIYNIIEKEFNNWDPESLLCSGANIDPYKSEINEIANDLETIENVFQLSKKIKYVFEKDFHLQYEQNDCFIVAENIWENLHEKNK
ncbi:DUF1871 family protein [Evansella sp. AB-P1]|uniref:DUF1871 family protein n=1 Tax=Evansella sp. AB-P1 TaxID=3037653 RepID=UPI00241CA43B|nr:DUF1871 family protein [Evansella sp. AB-P1]MDG5787151.1 DUF1871 family protein [Evansella sp. AB-P1]